MIVIADSSPLNYLILIQYVEVLAPLYTRIVVPETVTRDVAYALVRAPRRCLLLYVSSIGAICVSPVTIR